MAEMDRNVGVVLDAIARLRHRAQHDRHLGERRRRGVPPAVARHVGPVARVLQHGDGRRHPHAVHDSLARPHPGGPGLERDRARAPTSSRRSRSAAGAAGAEGPRASTASTSCRSSRASRRSRTATASSTSRGDAGSRGEMARLEAALRVAGRAGAAGRADHEAVQPAIRSEGRDRRQGLQSRRDRAVDRVVARFWTTVDDYRSFRSARPIRTTPPPRRER